jgi:hypothetical protein
MTSTDNLKLAAQSFGDDVKAFRSSAVTSENKGNTASRSLLASLVSGVMTEALAVAAIIHAFGNPKGAKGKPVETLSGLRNSTGGDAVRKMAETVFRIVNNIDADSVAPEGNDDWQPAIRPLVVSFILGEEGAPKSLRALNDAVNSALRAYAKATQPDNGEAEAEAEEGEAGQQQPVQSLTDRTLALMVAYENATDDEAAEAHEALEALFAMVNDRIAKAAEAATAEAVTA